MPTARSDLPLTNNPACNPLCGACHYKALDYSEQLERKQTWAKRNLGPWENALQQIIPAPPAERLAYRSKSWLRSEFLDRDQSPSNKLSFGMYRAVKNGQKWEQEFVSWDTCPIHSQPIQEMIEQLQTVLPAQARDFCARSLWGVWMGTPHLVVVARELELDLLRAVDWSRIVSSPFTHVWLHRSNQTGRRVFQHRHFHLLWTAETSAPGDKQPPILAFRQIAQTLLSEARQLASTHLLAAAPTLVVDLYCGTGELSRLLPPSVSWLGIELSQSAAVYANTLRDSKLSAHAAFTGTVEDRLRDPKVLEKITGKYALYINPPRSGISADARDRILALIETNPPATIVILSCSASSLARDLKPFEKHGYEVKLLQPYDFFPQTEHFETLAVLKLRS